VWTPFESISFATQEAAPGAVRRYSSTNYIVLGAIIEAATGKPVAQLLRERFFDPLHLNSMYLAGREPAGNRGTLAAPHDNISALDPIFQFTGQPTFPDTITNISRFPFTAIETIAFTSGGIVSNVSDMATWGNDLFSGRATGKVILDQMLQSISSTPDEDGDFLGIGIWRSTKISNTDVFIGHDGNATGYRSVMFYQPDRKMTIAILTNFHGAKLYAVAKALYAALPDFICGNENRDEAKIQLCWNGKSLCVAREAADGFIKRGAYLGGCEEEKKKNKATSLNTSSARKTNVVEMDANNLSAYPNPFKSSVDFSFRADQSGKAILRLYDGSGKLVTTLFNGTLQKSTVQKIVFQAGNLPSGIYFTQLQTAQGISRQKVVLQR
jgi:Beta-lactamase/Secretion system C-terminal sorting domain